MRNEVTEANASSIMDYGEQRI